MRPLRFVAVSEEGTHLVLAPDVPASIDNGERFLLPVDDRLKAAVRGDMSRLGQIEIELESSLRPRDIQARIRAGHTPEEVAAVAGVRVERVLRYAYPVLQEREGVATASRGARVRLADGTPASGFQEFLTERLALLDIDPRSASWDARRVGSGAWEVVVGWQAGPRTALTRWWFDQSARTVTPADADTSAFAEGSRSVVPRPVEHSTPEPSVGAPADPEPAPQPEPVDEPQPFLALGVPDPVPTGEDERDSRARIPSWEDIVFGVRRKR